MAERLARILAAAALAALTAFLSGCGGGGVGGDQSPLPVCEGNDVILPNGQCGPPPPPDCTPPEVAVDGRCVVPDKPTPKYTPGPNEAVIYYNRRDKEFNGWVVHLWNNGCEAGSWDAERITLRGPDGAVDYSYEGTGTSWPDGPPPNYEHYEDGQADPIYGVYWVLQLQDNGVCGNFIIHGPAGPPQTVDFRINFSEDTANPYRNMYWVVVDSTLAENELREARAAAEPICINDVCEEFEPPPLAIEDQAAHWLDAGTIVWNRDLTGVTLHSSENATLDVASEDQADGGVRGVVTGGAVAATLTATELTDEQRARAPHLADYAAYAVNLDAARVKELLTHQLWIVGENAEGEQFGTQLQLAQVLDSLYTSGEDDADESTLGLVYDGGNITSSVWAPTAQDVKLRVYNERADGRLTFGADVPMSKDAATGIWSVSGAAADWNRQFYRFVVTAYHPSEGRLLVREARDPYSVGAYTSSLASQFVNLNDDDLKPGGWDAHAAPAAGNPESAVIYEGHIRDFSVRDNGTPAEHRGKYLAFTAADSPPVRHLRALVDAGLTHFHVLPAFDIRSVNEDPRQQVNLDDAIFELCRLDDSNKELCPGNVRDTTTILEKLQGLDPATGEAREVMSVLAQIDGFNWGYDPVLYNVPEGGYATDPAGPARILEMRQMYQALHAMGLRVVMDVVYNHTSDEGADGSFSVFDRIVPGYYYRRNATTGAIERASCCSDTAAEHAMMGKFVKDSAVFWATHYKVDGFRFDWMSLHPKGLMEEVAEAVLAVDEDSYIYGEGWAPGTGSAGERIELSTQMNLAGTGIGTFNDRMRDRLRDLSISTAGDLTRLRAGLAGNLADFQLVLDSGVTVEASSDGGYTADPQEAVNYASVHDGMTLWDHLNQGGVIPGGPETATAERARMAVQAQSLVLLGQGVPFVHMGADLLRSKSLSHNSYNAGDWFNHVDFTGAANNWNVGLPPEGPSDELVLAAIGDANAEPSAADIQAAATMFREFLQMAQASPLFSLGSAAEVMDRVGFHNVGRGAMPNLIAMSIDDGAGTVTNTDDTPRADLDPNHDAVVVVFNGGAEEQTVRIRTATGFALHPEQRESADATVRDAAFVEGETADAPGAFTVPPRTTAVFVKAQGETQGVGLSAFVTSGFEPPVPYGDTAIFLRGAFNGWGADPLRYSGGGLYEGYLQLDAGDYQFKIASEDWSTVDISAPEGGTEITLGVPATLSAAGGQPNLSISVPAGGEYRFALDATNSAAPILTVTNARAFPAQTFVRGGFNGWSTDNPVRYTGAGAYQATIRVEAGEHQFKVASEDWNTVDLGGSAAPGGLGAAAVPVEFGAAVALAGPQRPNLVVNVEETGDYLFTLAAGGYFSNDDGQGGVTLWVTRAEPFAGTPVYLRGAFNSWGTANEMTFQTAAIYRTDLTLEPGEYQFKIASEDWATVNIGAADDPVVVLGEPLTLADEDGPANLQTTIAEADSYAFTLDLSRGDPVLLLRKSADVPQIEPPPPPPKPVLVEPLDFDDGAAHVFEDDAGVATVVVADPLDAAGVNMVAETTRGADAAADAGTTYALDGYIAFSDQLTHLAVDVDGDAAAGTMVSATVWNSDDAATAMTATAEFTAADGWETLHFDFSMFNPDVVYNRFKFVFDAAGVWRWDNVRVSKAPPGTAPPYGNTTVFVRGGFNGWGTDNAMTYRGNGVYALDIAVAPAADGAHQFKVASEDWATVNLGAANADDANVVVDAMREIVGDGDNLLLAVDEEGNYRFHLDANDSEAPTLIVVDLDAAPYGYGTEQSTIHARGGFNGWSTDNPLHYVGGGTYQGVVAIEEAGEVQFKVASEDWGTVNLGAADAGAATVTPGTPFAGFALGGDNLTLAVESAGEYLFTVTVDANVTAGTDAPTLHVTPLRPFGATTVFLRGGMNGWGTDDPLVFKGAARHARTVELAVGAHEFKVASEDWATVNMGAAEGESNVVVVGTAYSTLAPDGGNLTIDIAEEGAYLFEVDGTQAIPPTLTVRPAN